MREGAMLIHQDVLLDHQLAVAVGVDVKSNALRD